MAGLRGCAQPLAAVYDVGLLDLDGVVYVGPQPVPGAAEAISAARRHGLRPAYVTNNASRTPEQVVEHLREIGIDVSVEEVVTSAQAAARVLRDQLPGGSPVLVAGASALRQAVEQAGLVAVGSAADSPAAVVQGFDPQIGYPLLAEAALAVRAGALWVAANGDLTMPSPRGLVPGSGALVALVAAATAREPLVAGKPEPALHLESVRRTGARRPLVVGDRLDTDIEGATRAGVDSLLVLSGVTDAAQLCAAVPAHRPAYLGRDLSALSAPHPEVAAGDGEIRGDGLRARLVDGALEMTRDPVGPGPADLALAVLRVAAVGCWHTGRLLGLRPDPTDRPLQAAAGSWRIAEES